MAHWWLCCSAFIWVQSLTEWSFGDGGVITGSLHICSSGPHSYTSLCRCFCLSAYKAVSILVSCFWCIFIYNTTSLLGNDALYSISQTFSGYHFFFSYDREYQVRLGIRRSSVGHVLRWYLRTYSELTLLNYKGTNIHHLTLKMVPMVTYSGD